MDVALLIWAIALTVLVIVGIVWVLDLQARLRRLQRRSKDLFAGAEETGDTNIPTLLENLASRLAETRTRTEQLAMRTEQVGATLAHTVQGVGLVRFRAFQDTGGDQSFALALVDGDGNGVVPLGVPSVKFAFPRAFEQFFFVLWFLALFSPLFPSFPFHFGLELLEVFEPLLGIEHNVGFGVFFDYFLQHCLGPGEVHPFPPVPVALH